MPCVRFRVQSPAHAYSDYPRHRVNRRKEGHAPSDKHPIMASCATDYNNPSAKLGKTGKKDETFTSILHGKVHAVKFYLISIPSKRHQCGLLLLSIGVPVGGPPDRNDTQNDGASCALGILYGSSAYAFPVPPESDCSMRLQKIRVEGNQDWVSKLSSGASIGPAKIRFHFSFLTYSHSLTIASFGCIEEVWRN